MKSNKYLLIFREVARLILLFDYHQYARQRQRESYVVLFLLFFRDSASVVCNM